MGAAAAIIRCDIAEGRFFHDLGQCVPCTEILPRARIAQDANMLFPFDNGIIKADLFKTIICRKQSLVVRASEQGLGTFQNIAQTICKDTAVPECSLLDVLLCSSFIRLLPERKNAAHILLVLRHDIAVLLTRIGRLDAHQHEVRRTFCRKLRQMPNRGKIGILNIGVNRADSNRFIESDAFHIMQIGADKRDRRKRVTAAWLYGDVDHIAQLAAQSRNLCFRCRYRDLCVRNRVAHLAADTLRHRLPHTITLTKKGNELLGTNIIRQRPETFPRTA